MTTCEGHETPRSPWQNW